MFITSSQLNFTLYRSVQALSLIMNYNNPTRFFPMFPQPSFCHCCPPPPPPHPSFFQTSFISDIPLIIAPSPVPSTIFSSNNSDNRSLLMLPLRSSSFDFSSLIAKAQWRREQLGEYLECAFCKANGESYDIYSSHRLRDNEKMITLCPILRAHKCPRCNVSGDQAHTMKYCPIKAEVKATRRMREIELAMKKK